MQNFSVNPREIFASFWRNHNLILASIKRDVLGRYRGSVMGVLWSFLHPLFMLTVYTFVFSVVLQSRWGNTAESKSEYALVLFAGLIVFNLFAECINRAPGLIVSNPNYVKKVVYPLEILPWVSLGAACFHGAVSLSVWLIAHLIIIGPPHATIFFFPLVLAPLMMFIMGISWGLASLGVYLRDVGQLTGLLTTVMLFLSPIFYPVSALPESYRKLLYINPMTQVIEQTRDILVWGKSLQFLTVGENFLTASIIFWIGFFWFQKTRKGFADVI